MNKNDFKSMEHLSKEHTNHMIDT